MIRIVQKYWLLITCVSITITEIWDCKHSKNKHLLHLRDKSYEIVLGHFEEKKEGGISFLSFYQSMCGWAKIQYELVWYWQWWKNTDFCLKAEVFLKFSEIKIHQMSSYSSFSFLYLGKFHNHSISDNSLAVFQQNPGQSVKQNTLIL